tara:strand:- start:1363 stop:1545 length:183 start_codon:yes stop_codon:yes gene_type:complete
MAANCLCGTAAGGTEKQLRVAEGMETNRCSAREAMSIEPYDLAENFMQIPPDIEDPTTAD